MSSWAVVILDQELSSLISLVAGVPLWKRLTLTLQEAGLDRFLFLTGLPAADASRLQHDLAADCRFSGEAFWLPAAEAEGTELPPGLDQGAFLMVSGDVLFDHLLVRRFLASAAAHDSSGEETFALVDARPSLSCPTMAEVGVTQCYWRRGAPVAFCPSHVFHSVEFAGAFIFPPAMLTPLFAGWQSGGGSALMEVLTARLETGCKAYLISGRHMRWPKGGKRRSSTRAELALVSQLRVYRRGRFEGVIAGRISGWLALSLTRLPAGLELLATLSVLCAIAGATFLAQAAYFADLTGAALVVVAVILKGSLEDLGRLRFEDFGRIRRLAIVSDGAAKTLPLAGVTLDLTMVTGSPVPAAAGMLAVIAYLAAATWPTRKARGLLRRLRGNLRGYGFIYLLVATSLVGKSSWFLWGALIITWGVGVWGWLRRRRTRPLTRF